MRKAKRSRRSTPGRAQRIASKRSQRSKGYTIVPAKQKLPFFINKRLFYIIGIIALVGSLIFGFTRATRPTAQPIPITSTSSNSVETPTVIPTPTPSNPAP